VKFIFLVGDGMADDPQPALGGKTPLEAALTPSMDRIAERGRHDDLLAAGGLYARHYEQFSLTASQ